MVSPEPHFEAGMTEHGHLGLSLRSTGGIALTLVNYAARFAKRSLPGESVEDGDVINTAELTPGGQ
jgi:hypothetical protein